MPTNRLTTGNLIALYNWAGSNEIQEDLRNLTDRENAATADEALGFVVTASNIAKIRELYDIKKSHVKTKKETETTLEDIKKICEYLNNGMDVIIETLAELRGDINKNAESKIVVRGSGPSCPQPSGDLHAFIRR